MEIQDDVADTTEEAPNIALLEREKTIKIFSIVLWLSCATQAVFYTIVGVGVSYQLIKNQPETWDTWHSGVSIVLILCSILLTIMIFINCILGVLTTLKKFKKNTQLIMSVFFLSFQIVLGIFAAVPCIYFALFFGSSEGDPLFSIMVIPRAIVVLVSIVAGTFACVCAGKRFYELNKEAERIEQELGSVDENTEQV
jgi:MFS family permease